MNGKISAWANDIDSQMDALDSAPSRPSQKRISAIQHSSAYYALKQILIAFLLLIFAIAGRANIPANARIQAGASGVKVRASPGSATVLGINNAGTYGTVLSGPMDAKISGSTDQTIYHWYNITWDSPATSGWSADVGFTQPTPNGPTPQSPGYEAPPGQVLGPSSVSFRWTAASTADAKVTTGYELVVYDLDASIESTYSVGISTSQSVQLSYGHHYFWLVYAYNANLFGTSPTPYFWIATKPTINNPGYSSAPGQPIPNLTPAMSWNALSGVQNYKLYVLQYPYGSADTIYTAQTSSSQTSFTIPSGVLPANTACLWKLTALFGDALESGVESDPSDPLFFQSPALYKLNVQVQGSGSYMISPPGGSYTAGTMITITPIPNPGSQFSEWTGSQNSRNPVLSFGKGGADENIQLCFIPIFTASALTATMAGSTPSTIGIGIPTTPSWVTLCEMSSDLQFWQLLSVLDGQSSGVSIQLPTSGTSAFVTTSYSPQVSTTPFLSFPIHAGNFNPHTAPVTAIMDHKMRNPNIAKAYDKDMNIRTAEGATYAVLPEDSVRGKDFAILPPNTIVSTLFTYVGVSEEGQSGPGYLQYDGHPGYDYGFGLNTDVYAAAAGVVMTDDDLAGSNLATLGMASYYMDRYHALIINHGNGYCSIYMHLSSIDSPYVDESDPNSWKPVKASVAAGAHIGTTGNFDKLANPPLAYHFHFEVWRLDAGNWNYADPYGFSGPGQDGVTTVTITPPLWNGN